MYLYRVDTIKAVSLQRLTDPVLRGRRTTGSEAYHPHKQIAQEVEQLRAGEAVFQLFFWKDWSALMANVWSHLSGGIIQRVRADHDALQRFKRDDDQYLSRDSFIFWGRFPVEDPGLKWSPVGIPHTDIEVLHPDGYWTGMDSVPALSENPGYSWACAAPIRGGGPLWWTICGRPGDYMKRLWVVIRQPRPLGRHTQTELIASITERENLDPAAVRWIQTYETSDAVTAEEVFVKVWPAKPTPGDRFKQLLGRPTPRRATFTDAHSLPLEADDVDSLYAGLGLSEWLRRGARWDYRALEAQADRFPMGPPGACGGDIRWPASETDRFVFSE